MKRRPLLGLPLALAAGALARPAAAQPRSAQLQPWRGDPRPPPLALRRLDGRPLTLAELQPRVVLVNFWATWCEPCIEEMPSMQRLRDRLGSESFEIVAVNYMEGEPRIEAFLARLPLSFPIVRDTDGDVARQWKVRVFPSSFVLDRAGMIRLHLVGSIDWLAPPVETLLRPLLQAAARRV